MKRGLILSFLQMKGGVGKSTLAENLAVAFSYDKKKIKIIDCDARQRTCSKWVARRNEYHPKRPSISCSIEVDNLKNTVIENSQIYDILIIDVQGSDSKNLRMALLLSDIIYLPFLPSQNDLETIEEIAELLEETQMQNSSRKTLFILNNCSYHYLDKAGTDANDFLDEYRKLITPSKVTIYNRKIYKSMAMEGLGVIEGEDIKAKKEITDLKNEVKQYA